MLQRWKYVAIVGQRYRADTIMIQVQGGQIWKAIGFVRSVKVEALQTIVAHT